MAFLGSSLQIGMSSSEVIFGKVCGEGWELS
jgi:hypothetical protein